MTAPRILVVDTETATLSGPVCDLAFVEVDENLNILHEHQSLIDPECPISPASMGVHHITNEMVADAPTMAEYLELHGNPFDHPDLILIGHNIQFDARMLKALLPARYRKLCTLRIAKNMWCNGEVDDHKLQTLRYTFGLQAGDAHRAMGDVITCLSLLRALAEANGYSFADLLDLGQRTLSPETRIGFGKHKGTKLKDLDKGYVRWLLNQADMDADLVDALKAI